MYTCIYGSHCTDIELPPHMLVMVKDKSLYHSYTIRNTVELFIYSHSGGVHMKLKLFCNTLLTFGSKPCILIKTQINLLYLAVFLRELTSENILLQVVIQPNIVLLLGYNLVYQISVFG